MSDLTMSDLVKRLRKSNAENAYRMLFREAADRIEELEAENRIFRSTESVSDSTWDALLEQVRQLQTKLARVARVYHEATVGKQSHHDQPFIPLTKDQIISQLGEALEQDDE